jgi:hypothetical protein
MANPFPFVANSILTAAQLNGIGETVSFTPTWTGLTVGNGTQSFKYVRVQDLVFISGKITLGSTSAVTGNVYFTTPVTSNDQADISVVGLAYLSDAGAGFQIGTVVYSGNLLILRTALTNGTYLQESAFSSTVPFTWAATDSITVSLVYQV